MKTFSIMETQHNLARVLREVEAGGEVGITRRRKLVARILPPVEQQAVEWPDFAARAHEVWGGAWVQSGAEEILDESRGSR